MDEKERQLKILELEHAKEKKLCEGSFYQFFLRFWDILEPATPLVLNWHLKIICDVLQEETERIAAGIPKKHDLIINIPPRSLKSTLLTKMLNAWTWVKWPYMKFVSSSYDKVLVAEHSVATRRLINSERYQYYWNDRFKMTTDQDVKQFFENDKTGYRIAVQVGTGTGRGGNVYIIDDAINAEEANSGSAINTANRWFDLTASTRLNNPVVDMFIFIMQRLNEDDLVGHVLSRNPNRYRLICIPAEETDWISPPELREYYKNGLFFSEKFTRKVLDDFKETLGDYGYSGQFLQKPSPGEGGMFKKECWKFWIPKGSELEPPRFRVGEKMIETEIAELPDKFDDVIDSWDFAFKSEEIRHDNVSGVTWGKNAASFYLLDRIEGNFDFLTCLDKLVELRYRGKQKSAILVEDKANGPAIINTLERKVPGIIPIQADRSTGGKIARAQPVSSLQRAGNLYLPHPKVAPWVEDFIKYFADFPKSAKKKGDVDSTSQAINRFTDNKRIIPTYSSLNEKQHDKFNVAKKFTWSRTFQYLAAMHQEKNMKVHILVFFWDRQSSHLYVIKEHIFENPLIQDITYFYKKLDRKPIISVDRECLIENQSIAKVLKREAIRITELKGYDELGTIAVMNKLMKNNNITIHSDCTETDRQLMVWSLAREKPEQIGFGFCKCICYILNNLKPNIEEKETIISRGYKQRGFVMNNDMPTAIDNYSQGDKHKWLKV